MDEDIDEITGDGVRVVRLSSWREFHQTVLSLESKRGYVWRGQNRDEAGGWRLLSSFDREVKSENQRDRDQRLRQHLQSFKEEMAKSYPDVIQDMRDEVEIWALGQHYGLKTPFLDWTLSPYIAAYFAFEEAVDQNGQNDCYRYVYALDRSTERLIVKLKREGQTLAKKRAVPFHPTQLLQSSPRFKAQQSIFTEARHGEDIRRYVQVYSGKRSDEVLLVKFRIPTNDREMCLRDLRLMNIDHMSLLLDLRDAVNTCNKHIATNGTEF